MLFDVIKVLACYLMSFCLAQKLKFILIRGGDRNLTTLVGNLTKGDETAKTVELAISFEMKQLNFFSRVRLLNHPN